jgi:hypothetical protein
VRGILLAGRDSWSGLGPVIATLAVAAAFLPLRGAVGAAPALLAVGAALGMLAGRKEGRSPLRSAVEGAVLALLLFALFRYVLSVPLR